MSSTTAALEGLLFGGGVAVISSHCGIGNGRRSWSPPTPSSFSCSPLTISAWKRAVLVGPRVENILRTSTEGISARAPARHSCGTWRNFPDSKTSWATVARLLVPVRMSSKSRVTSFGSMPLREPERAAKCATHRPKPSLRASRSDVISAGGIWLRAPLLAAAWATRWPDLLGSLSSSAVSRPGGNEFRAR